MADLKEPAHNLWANYGSPVQMHTGRFNHPTALDPVLANTASGAPQAPSPHSARPRTDNPYPYARYPQEETDMYGRPHPSAGTPTGPPQHSGLSSHHSYPNLKRSYSQSEQQPPPYTEMVQDMRDDGSKLNVNQGHRLLSFKRVPDKHTLVDQHGQVQQLDLSAQLHGMFFLSEMPANTGDGGILQPELTCYRRNLFQISGTLITPRGMMSLLTDGGETVAINSTELTISAIESVDGHPVRLIVIPWKTPPPNSPEINQSPDQEPAPLPLIPFHDDGSESDGEYAVYPIGWRRLQFRIATANNGRRKELQQHFVLHLKAIGTLATGSKIVMAEATTAPVVVRGRSPRNFQARKEIPLLGSSAGSRGQALVETGLGIVAGPLAVKPHEKARPVAMEMPRSSFTFSAGPKMPPSPLSMRSNSYPAWNQPQMPLPPASNGSYPATTMTAEPYQKISASPQYTAEPQELPMQQQAMPSVQLSLVGNEAQQPNAIRTQYAYVQGTSAPPPQLSLPTSNDNNLNIPRYVDTNPRSAKSPRHANHDSVHSSGSMNPNTDASSEYRYGSQPYMGVGAEMSAHQQHPVSHGQTHQSSAQQSPAQPQNQSLRSQPPSQHPSPHTLPPPMPHQSSHQQYQPPQQPSQPGYGSGAHDAASNSSNPPSATSSAQQPTRDYFPPSASWTSTAGEANPPAYANGESRPYSFPDQYKTGHTVKSEALPQPHNYGAPRGSFDTINHYSWNAT